jgi:hypothetical protein
MRKIKDELKATVNYILLRQFRKASAHMELKSYYSLSPHLFAACLRLLHKRYLYKRPDLNEPNKSLMDLRSTHKRGLSTKSPT